MSLWTVTCVIALTVAGLMVGNEVAVGVFVHPQLWKLDDATHTKVVQALARALGAVMPFWYAATLATSALVAYLLRSDSPRFWLAVTATVLWLFSIVIVYTGVGPVAINNEVGKWDLEALPASWREIRIVILLVAFVCLAGACVQ